MRSRGFGSSLRIAAGAALVLAGVSGAEAGFFERLFGMEPEPEPQGRYLYQHPGYNDDGYGEPLDFTVRRRAEERARERERIRRETREAAVQTPIDPEKVPDWHLQDPTLRRGDIVVLKNEVLVFKGGRLPHTRADFTTLQQSDLPKAERERLAAMTGLKPVLPPRTAVASAAAD